MTNTNLLRLCLRVLFVVRNDNNAPSVFRRQLQANGNPRWSLIIEVAPVRLLLALKLTTANFVDYS
jgi:hypothetical protein